MRNLKRALSLAMATFMLLGMMVVGAGAADVKDFSDKEQIVNTEAVYTLAELGVILGNTDGSYNPTGIVTRAQMAKMICVVLNGGKDPTLGSSATSSYTDVLASNWASPYIEYCTNLGILAGYGNGVFKPDATVTGSEAAKMLLTAIGYQSSIEGFVGPNWAVPTNVRASQIGLYDGLDLNPSEGLIRDNAAQMVYNALDARVVTYKYTLVSDGQGGFKSVTELQETNAAGVKATVLEDKFKAVKVEAIVTSNETATLDNNYRSSEDAGKTYLVRVPETLKGTTGIYKVTTDKDLLGQSVYVYIKYKDDRSIITDAVVIGKPIATEKNKIVESHDGTGLADLLSDNKLTISTTGTQYFVNYGGTIDAKGDVTTMTKAEFDTLIGYRGISVRLIDNNADKVVDYALAEKYNYGSVSKYVTAKETDSFRINSSVYGEDYDTDQVVGFEDVTLNDFVLFNEYGGKIYVQKPETFEGILKDYSTSKENVTVDETTVSWSGLFTVNASDLLGLKKGIMGDDLLNLDDYLGASTALDANATFYKDIFGYIIAVGDADESALNYAVLLGFENQIPGNAGVLGSEAKAKLLLADGTQKTYSITHINGQKITDCATKGTATGGQVGFNAKDQYKIYSYVLTDGNVKLTYKTSNIAESTALTGTNTLYKRGASTIVVGSTNYTVTNSTVFLYIKTNGTVGRYVGKTAPTIDDGSGHVVSRNIAAKQNNRGEALVVVLQGINPQNEFKDNFVYVYKHKVSQVTDGYRLDVILNSDITSIIVPDGGATLGDGKGDLISQDWYTDDSGKSVYGHVIANPVKSDNTGLTGTSGLYSYSKNDDGTYDLKYADVKNTEATGFYAEGTVKSVSTSGNNAYVRLVNSAGHEYSYTLSSTSEIFYARTDKPAESAVSIYKGDRVVLVHDEDDRVVDAFVIYRSYDMNGGGSVTPPAGTPATPYAVTVSGTTVTIKKYAGDNPSITDIIALLKSNLSNVKTVSATSATTYTVTFNDGSTIPYTVAYTEMAKVTYNGTDHFLAANETLTVTTNAASACNLVAVTTDSSGNVSYANATVEADNVTYKVTAADVTAVNLVLADGYTVADSLATSATFKTHNGKSITTTVASIGLVAGDVLTVKAAATKTATATDASGNVLFTTASTTGETFEMPAKNVTLTEATTPTPVTIAATKTGTNTTLTGTNLVFATDSSSFTISVVPTTGMSGASFQIIVTPVDAKQDLTIALADKTASADSTITPAAGLKFAGGSTGALKFTVTPGAKNLDLEFTVTVTTP